MENSRDFSFSGRGTLGGGDYGLLKFSGSGHINGDVTCTNLHSSGSLKAEGNICCSGDVHSSGTYKCSGNLSAEKFSSSGTAIIDQDITVTGKMDASGTTKIGGSLNGGQINTSGALHVGGGIQSDSLCSSGSASIEMNVRAEKIDCSGSIQIGGDCEAESFSSSGKVLIDGLLNAEDIRMKLGKADSRIGEIGGKRIDIRRIKIGEIIYIGLLDGIIITNAVEGDEIYLENTKAKIVRGTNVVIGSGCEVDEAEYSGSFERANDAIVKNLKKIGE